MVDVCESCAHELTDQIVVKCNAFCSSKFCQRCSRMPDEILRAVNSSQNLFWACDACTDLMKKSRFRNAMVSVNDVNHTTIDELKAEIRDYVLGEIKTEIRLNFKNFADNMPVTPIGTLRPLVQVSTRSKRNREDDIDQTRTRPQKLFRGTGVAASSGMTTTDGGPTIHEEDRFWLYLSGISPEVTDDAVSSLVSSALETNDSIVTKLVPRGKDMSTLSFISFKVGLHPSLKEKAMTASSWPRGLVFREFVDDSRDNRRGFWKPSITTADTGPTPATIIQ